MIKVLIRCIITGVIILTLSVSLFSSRIFAQAGTVKAEQKISDTQGGFTGTLNNNDFFGFTSASIGDLNNDGIIDIVVGALADDDGGNNRGAVWILFMNTDGTVNGYSKISDTQGGFTGTLDNDDCFGYAVASLGDLDGDGISDLAVGAYFDDDGGSARGAVWVLFMNNKLYLKVII
ncbi:MAG: FG-GAP repeat protein [Bacteroidetes bacterium]|nr:FG-GAP repeat protein [Bacteroidota bacterium]